MTMKKMLVFLFLWLYLINHLQAGSLIPGLLKFCKKVKCIEIAKEAANEGLEYAFDRNRNEAQQGNDKALGKTLTAAAPPPPPTIDTPAPEAPEAYPVFKSIDCGGSGNFTDHNSITWTGDEDMISNGFPHTVKTDTFISPIYNTLRAFNNTRKKNCYSIKAIEGGKVLVRVAFNYGNYDGKESPPMFGLHFDGNFWITVDTSNAPYYEAIYVVKRKVISVCVARIDPNQDPFISTIEVRSIDSEVYNMIGPDYALLTNYRIGYGLDNTTRFPADPYDRVWVPISDLGTGLEVVPSSASVIDFTTLDHPPETVLASAVVTSDISIPRINLDFDTFVYPYSYPVYINWYFTEVNELTEQEKRSFRIYKDDKPFSYAIVPGLGNVSESSVSGLLVEPLTTFSIVAESDSTLPPLINAIEIFSIKALTNGTDDNDVEGLDSLKDAFDVLKDWRGDPCLPANYSWDWIECNNDATPRVTSLNLNGYNLNGPLPDFSSMNALEIIDMHNTGLTGPVPDFLGDMESLKELNLADNQLTGPVPSSLLRNSQLNLTVTGNSLLTGNSDKKKISKLSMILAITIPAFFIF